MNARRIRAQAFSFRHFDFNIFLFRMGFLFGRRCHQAILSHTNS
jgi:hypothetical protein